MSLGIIFGIITMLSWGFSDFFAAKTARKEGVTKTIVWSQGISVAIFFVIFALFFDFPKLSLTDAVFIAICAAMGALGIFSLYKGFEVGSLSIVSPIAAASAVVTVALSVIFLGEKLSIFQGFGIILAILGAILASFRFYDIAKLKFNMIAAGVKFGAAAMICFGISFALIGILIEKFGWFVPVFLIRVLGLFLIIIVSLAMKKEIYFPKNTAMLIISIAVLESVAFLSIGRGISMEYAALVYSVASAFPAVTIILAKIFLREFLELNQKIGVIAVLIGLVLLSI